MADCCTALSCSSPDSSSSKRRRSVLAQLSRGLLLLPATSSFLPANAVTAADRNYTVPTPRYDRQLSWPLGKVAFSLLPLAGGERRATILTELVPGTIYALDQIQGIVNVNVPVRMIVIKLQQRQRVPAITDGDYNDDDRASLWLHNPIAPTPQALGMIRDLEETLHAKVRHIVLGTVALEHKATFGPFVQYFPNATLHVQPGQWSFPVNVPLAYLSGIDRRRLQVLGDDAPAWRDEIDYRILGPLQFQSVGGYSESAFYHRPSQSLIVTDLVVAVSVEPPMIVTEDPRALLYHARDHATELVDDTADNRRKGWRRMVQFGLYFFPSQITVTPSISAALNEAKRVPAANRNLGRGAIPFVNTLYPWSWNDNDADLINFQAVATAKLFLPPILTKLILDREPRRVVDFAETVARDFPDLQRILPSHLDCPITCTARDWREAFRTLESTPERIIPPQSLAADLALLQAASDALTKLGVVAPSQVCDGEMARQEGRFRNKVDKRRTTNIKTGREVVLTKQ
jgi:hypothetical protein